MRISDWSSDVCSSDLLPWRFQITVRGNVRHTRRCRRTRILGAGHQIFEQALAAALAAAAGFAIATQADRKSVASGKSVSVRVDLGGRRITHKKQNQFSPQNTKITNR